MTVTNHLGTKNYPFMYLGNSRKPIYYNTLWVRKRDRVIIGRKRKPRCGARECARRIRQMSKKVA
jgi:hypothetical protein